MTIEGNNSNGFFFKTVVYLLDEGDARVEVLKEILPTVVENRDSLVGHRAVLLEEIRNAVGGVHPVSQSKSRDT